VLKKFLIGKLLLLSSCLPLSAWQNVQVKVPSPPREFRAAWVACIYNLDWPSRSGLDAATQQQQMLALLDKARSLKLNAIILQVRPACDAVYASKREPWTHWLSGRAGVSPGYDPLAFAVAQAHARGIEVHAWFNPFRAQAGNTHPLAANSLASSKPGWIVPTGKQLWLDPGLPDVREWSLDTILDVVKRYDIDGVHLDDYFYPYPQGAFNLDQFNDRKSYAEYGNGPRSAWRRTVVDSFVQKLYKQVKAEKPWVRVGISPFGIWRPGVPQGIEAGIDAYEHLACDSRKWLERGWVDYLAPQLYWRCAPAKQSFPKLLGWWRAQSNQRPVWPGIAVARINSSEDPGRPASEISRQIQFSRTIGSIHNGCLFWSMKALLTNRGGVNAELSKFYTGPALPPSMPWSDVAQAKGSALQVREQGNVYSLSWDKGKNVRKWVIQGFYEGRWSTHAILPGNATAIDLPQSRPATIFALTPVNASGSLGATSCSGN